MVTEKKRAATSKPRQGQPTRAQQEVLNAYYAKPIVAEVARDLGVSERSVGRIVHRFHDQLDRRWSERDAEQQARADARHARIEEWIDAGVDEAMTVIDACLQSENESIRLRAAKLRLDLALRKVDRRIGDTPLVMRLGELTSGHIKALRTQSADTSQGEAGTAA